MKVFTRAVLSILLAGTVISPLNGQNVERTENAESMLEELRQVLFDSQERVKALGENEDVPGRQAFFYYQRSFPYANIPENLVSDAVRYTEDLKRRYLQGETKGGREFFAQSAWENIGPFNVAGRVRAIALHPTKPANFFIGAASGGVWEYQGNATSWETTFDKQSALAVGALAFDPNNHDHIYVGTGEVIISHVSTFNATPAYFGDGIFHSTDGGETWRPLGLSNVGTFSAVHVHKDSSNVLYATAAQGGGGFYRSSDGGQSWARTSTQQIFGLAVHPENNDYLVVAFADAISYSRDGGRTFTTAPGFSPSGGIRTSIDICRDDPSVLWALVARIGGQNNTHIAQVYRSIDTGKTWNSVHVFTSTGFFRSQGYYNNCVAVDPEDPDHVLIGGIDLYRTTDGGGSWNNVTNSYRGGIVHPDQHVIAFDQDDPDLVYLGNDGGVYRSTSRGRFWERISLSLPITQYYAMAVDQTRSHRVYGGTQDNGSQGAYGTAGWAHDWIDISEFGGDGFHVVVDKSDPGIIYAESQYGRLFRVDASNPRSYSYLTSTLDNDNSPQYDPGMWSTPIAQSPVDRQTLFSGRTNLWFSVDYGSNWYPMEPGNSAKISAIGLSPHLADNLMIGTLTGDLRYSTDGGENWARSQGVPTRYIADIMYDPNIPGRVYVVVSGSGTGHIYRSDDAGATFVDVSSNLPDLPTSAIEIDPSDSDVLFAGNDIGVFITFDGGELWLPFNENLPHVPVVDMEIHRGSRRLIAATHGRSMWAVSIDNPQPQPMLVEPGGGVPQPAGEELRIRWAGFGDASLRVLISYDGGLVWDTIAVGHTGSSLETELPFIKTSNALIRIEEIDGTRSVTSDPFIVAPEPNVQNRGERGFRAGALAIRGNELWASDRAGGRLKRLRLPLLLAGQEVVLPELDRPIIDMAWDPASDLIFLLTEGDFERPSRIIGVDTTGAIAKEFSAPADSLAGIAVTVKGMQLISKGTYPVLYTMNAQSGDLLMVSNQLLSSVAGERISLTRDDEDGVVQALDDVNPGATLPDELHYLEAQQDLTLKDALPLVPSGDDGNLTFFGLEYYADPSKQDVYYFYLTDTAGSFHVVEVEAGIGAIRSTRVIERPTGFEISGVQPSPIRRRGEVQVELLRAGELGYEIFDANGALVHREPAVRVTAGSRALEIDAGSWSSGLFYMSVYLDRERTIIPLVVVK